MPGSKQQNRIGQRILGRSQDFSTGWAASWNMAREWESVTENRFRNIAEGAPVMIIYSDADGGSSFVNKMRREFTGRNWSFPCAAMTASTSGSSRKERRGSR
jgi:hypothetical protein